MRRFLVCGLLVCTPAVLAGQSDSVTVVAGRHYAEQGVRERILGSGYRDLWTTPVKVPVLNPATYAGGLTPTQRGGGAQTKSLRLRGADGREYVFRSVDKDASGGLPRDLRNTVVDNIIQDQTSAKHPASALVVPPLLDAAQVLHASPRLVVMPDHPFLGEFRQEFAGMLGIIEERPNEAEAGGRTFAGAARIAGTETVLEHLEESSEHRVDSRAYLRARLMDIFFGDWDRHPDQWRWARFDRGGRHIWHPIPRDRDNAFVDYNGLLMQVARASTSSKWVAFDEEYPSIRGLTMNAEMLDRRFLSDLPKAVWDSTAAALQVALSDPVIESAVRRMPPEYYARSGPQIAQALKARRERLRTAADIFYAQLAGGAEVRATDERDVAEIDRLPGGDVEVRLYRANKEGTRSAEPYFYRRFAVGETDEVRIYLHGGDDHATVRGDAERSMTVRIIGGGGDDVLVNSSRVRGGKAATSFHDDRGENRFVTAGGATVDRRAPVEPDTSRMLGIATSYRDRGTSQSWFQPWAEWKSNVGVVIGGGPEFTQYGFRRDPYAYRIGARVLYAPQHTRFAGEVFGDFRQISSPAHVSFLARASNMEVVRFHGFGNETPSDEDDDFYRTWQNQYLSQTTWHLPLYRRTELAMGPVVKYYDPETEAATPAFGVLGSEAFGQAGAEANVIWDRRDSEAFPRSGALFRVGGSAFPIVWGGPGLFGETHVNAFGYVPVPLPLDPVLALRAGGKMVWGDYPYQEAAFVGGSGTLRGYPNQRFAGDAAVFGGAELRAKLFRTKLLVRGDLGAFVLADAARVFVDGESSDEWHTGAGGGLWFSFLDNAYTVSASYARGEDGRFYFTLGFPY